MIVAQESSTKGGVTMRTKFLAGFLFATLVLSVLANVGYGAEPPYPTRQIQLVVAGGAGGGTDIVARAFAQFVSKKLGQQILVVNKPGGGTVVGTHYGLKETKPDGYSFHTDTHACSSMMIAGMLKPPATLEDRVFISRVIVDSMVYAVKVDAPWKTFRELTEWVKTHIKELTYGAGGPAGTSAYGVNDWLSNIGLNPLDARLVTTDSGMDALIKVAGGHTTLACNTVAEAYTLAQAGKIRVLAVASDKRSPFMPDVPTVAENGLPPVRVSWWAGISAPKGTPQYVVDKWAKALEEVSKDPAFLQQVQNLHYTVSYLGPVEFKDYVYKETEHYTQIANKVGIRK